MHPLRSVSFSCIVVIAGSLCAEVLHTDGIIRVRNGNWRNARITVVPEFSEPFEIDLTSSKFELDLPLYSTYLLRAEHTGCSTKEVIFDCTVPPHFGQTHFTFPFQIDLEVESSDTIYPYAGPVGLVTFDEGLADFTYVTDYTRIHGVATLSALHARMPDSRLDQPFADPAMERSLGNGSTSDVEISGADPLGVSPQVVDIASMEEQAMLAETLWDEPVRKPAGGPSTPDVTLANPTAEEKKTVPAANASSGSTPAAVVVKSAARKVRIVNTPVEVEEGPCGTRTFREEPRCLVWIHRVPSAEGCTEFRKVVHAYGGVFYFHEGRSVTEEVYRTLLSAQL